ncbi:MAG: ribonuclease H-like domain-containing protein [Janthinobacterium lividum]
MDFNLNTYHTITGGFKTVPDNFMPATGVRALLLEDPFLLWCQFHSRDHGFEKDKGEFSLSDFIMSAGREFEAAWIENVCGDDVTFCLRDDRDVRRAQGVLKTLELMHKKTPVIAHAALWNFKARIYGSADLLVLTSWLYEKFPHLKPKKPEQDHYCVIDLKFTRGLHKPAKAKSLAAYGAQTRIYSYAVGHMQGYMPKRAYLVSRDRHDDPIPVEVTSKIGKPLDKDLADLRDQYLAIKQNKNWLPWKNAEVAVNFSNAQNAPWSGAKQRVAEEFLPGRPLEWLPRIGKREAASLQKLGYQSLDDMLSANPDDLPLEQIYGIGESSARQIRAVLKANRSHRVTPIPSGIVPKAKAREMFVDYEYLPDLRCRYGQPWPKCLDGHEMVFLIGCGWEEEEAGRWRYKQFVAEHETLDAETKMWQQFLAFLKAKDVLGPDADAVLWHFSAAEVWQSDRAASRCGLPVLSNLPWCDLQKSVLDLPFACPGAWSFGLKPLVKALSKIAPDYAVEWPKGLGDGAAAAAVGWKMYDDEEPLKTREYDLLGQYLEIDCKSMWQLLRWMRANCADADKPAAKKTSAMVGPEWRLSGLPVEVADKRHENGWYALATAE